MNSENILRRRHLRKRRGIGTLWLILILPLAMILLCVVLEVGNLWLARQELEDAMEAAALAAVKQWADPPVADTLTPREVGVQYAAANTASGTPVMISTNYDMATGGVNQNADCDLTNIVGSDGILVFGAITNDTTPYTFNAGVQPSCGVGSILFDASSNNLALDDSWGISFQDDNGTGLTITQVTITVPIAYIFDFTSGPAPVFSTNSGPRVQDNSGNSQPDNVGLAAADVTFSPIAGTTQTLTIDFAPGTFSNDERFRFGASVVRNGMGGGTANGDEVAGSILTVTFSNGTTQMLTLVDEVSTRMNDCLNPGDLTTIPGRVIVHQNPFTLVETPDLPCPGTSSRNNNQQSASILSGGSGNAYAVRAHAQKEIPSVCANLFGCPLGPFTVRALADAQYDCVDQEPELIRVGTFICPGP